MAAVLDEDDAEDLIDAYYEHRNETAHEGKLHGLEKSLGRQLARMIGESDPGISFAHVLLVGLRSVTRQLLLRALGVDQSGHG